MNPENVILKETIKVGGTPEEVQFAVAEAMQKVNAAIASADEDITVQKVETAIGQNPYADRVFKADETYPGKLRRIILFPHEELSRRSMNVTVFDDLTRKLAADLVATAKASNAAGLSAIQLDIPVRVIAVNVGASDYIVMVNPIIVERSAEKLVVTEGCLSFPGVTERVERSRRVRVSYQDLTGAEQEATLFIDGGLTGPAAQAVQHEYEHLEGKTLLDNLNLVHRDRIRRHMKQVHRKLDTIVKKTGGKVTRMQALFGFVPSEES